MTCEFMQQRKTMKSTEFNTFPFVAEIKHIRELRRELCMKLLKFVDSPFQEKIYCLGRQ